jgi:cell division septation protein DedD
LTSQSEAINLQVPENVELKDYLGERVFATGKYNQESRTLVVGDAKDIEVLPQDSSSIPTSTPTQTPTPFPTVEPTEIPTGPEAAPTQPEELPEI